MTLNIDSSELLLLKVLVADEISKLEQRIEIWKEDVVASEEDKKTIIDFNKSQVNVACKLYQKLLNVRCNYGSYC